MGKYYAINFDLHIKSLEQYYSKKNPNEAYRELNKYFYDIGWEHRQGSGYRSTNKLNISDVMEIAANLEREKPWITQCLSHMDITEIGRIYDYKVLMEKMHNDRNKDETKNLNDKMELQAKKSRFAPGRKRNQENIKSKDVER